MRNVSDNSCRENQNTFFVDKLSLENRAFYEIMWKNKETDDNMDMRISRQIPKATNTRSEYVIFNAFPLQQCLHKHASRLRRTYIACHVVF
jgi:hypothetical protein